MGLLRDTCSSIYPTEINMKQFYLLLTLLLFLPLFLSCGGNKDLKEPGRAAIYYINCLYDGHFEDYVAGMQSCDSASVDYRKNQITLLKQMTHEKCEELGKLKKATYLRSELNQNGQSAQVFLNLQFEKDTIETVLLPLILKDGKWRMQ